jgi:hypothetical protein
VRFLDGSSQHNSRGDRLYGGEKRHEVLVLPPRGIAVAIGAADCTCLQRLRLHLEVDLCVAVRGFERDVAEPGADGVDIDAGTEQVDGSCMPDGVRAHAFLSEGGHRLGHLHHRSCDQGVNAEAGDRTATHGAKDLITGDNA